MRRNFLWAVIALPLFFSGCSRKHRPVDTTGDRAEICKKRDLYVSLLQERLDPWGWAAPKCDGLLFNSLLAVSGFPVDIYKAEESPGRWRRHPDFDSCKPGAGSKSTISKDMFRGLFLYLLSVGDRDAMVRIRAYGEANGWAMGEAQDPESFFGRVLMSPSMSYQLSRMISKTPVSEMMTVQKPDFEGHLDVLDIYTEGMLYGAITDAQLATLKVYAETWPLNGLYAALWASYSDGDMQHAIASGMNEKLFPPDRLPRDTDRYTHYLWQRDHGPDWEPCGGDKRPCEGVEHSGIDLIFLAHIIGC